MHLFDPLRPQASPNQPALLLDGSAVPHVVAMPTNDATVVLSVMLNNYDAHGGYSYRHAKVTMGGLRFFFLSFVESPEDTLKSYFDWEPQERRRASPPPAPKAALAAEIADYVNELL